MTQKLKDNEFLCVVCREVFTKGWTDMEAAEELKELFGDIPVAETETVCDPCFKKQGFPENAPNRINKGN
jgi:hypothetical protein